MKQALLLVALLVFNTGANAQLVSCRPRICMVSYGYHDDNVPNTIKDGILAANPDLLIENTPGSYWGEVNNGIGCNPAIYIAQGIKVYAYIVGGYEGTHYVDNRDNLALNIGRVVAIANDGATGVFLDEVTAFPNTAARQQYIAAIDSACDANGLELILNPGTYNFSPWLMSHCDYIMTDESYDGVRLPTASELPYLNQVIVIADTIHNANDGADISLGARTHCFGYSYACDTFTALPVWIDTYLSLITNQPPTTPVITQNGNILQSSASCGNQWYEQTAGIIANETGETFTPVSSGTYFSIVNLDNCPSDTSNAIVVMPTSISEAAQNLNFDIYPNPASESTFITWNTLETHSIKLSINNTIGQQMLSTLLSKPGKLQIGHLPPGTYIVIIDAEGNIIQKKLVISR